MTAAIARPDAARHGTLREGILVGAVGATALALWFLLVDVVAGHPLFTPALLGAVVAGEPDAAAAAEAGNRVGYAALYTPIHYLVFAVVGVAAVAVVHRVQRSPALLGLLVMLFFALQVGIMGLVAVLEQGALGGLAWWQIALGNLVALGAIAAVLWRRHPGAAVRWEE